MLATTTLGTIDGPDQTFTTQGFGELVLPDHREWEKVSPRDKHGALLLPIDSGASTNGTVIQSAADGGALAYVANAPTEAVPQGNSNDVQVLSHRTNTGWETHDLTVPHLEATDASVGPGNEYRFFSEDLSTAIVQPFGRFAPLSPDATEQTAYVQDQATGAFTPLVTGAPGLANDTTHPFQPFGQLGSFATPHEGQPCPPAVMCGPKFVGATSDDTHVLLGSKVALTETLLPNTKPQLPQLYEWTRAAPPSEQLRLVSVLPADEGGGAPEAGAELGDHNNADARNAISPDGARVFFASNSQLYLRNNATQPQSPIANGKCAVPADACTIRLDLPAAGFTAVGSATAQFQFASSNGSRVFFTDTQRLTADAGGGMTCTNALSLKPPAAHRHAR